MRLSTAIRKGATMKPQAHNGSSYPKQSCVIQAALDGYGVPAVVSTLYNSGQTDYTKADKLWPMLSNRVKHPLTGICQMMDILWNLNDIHKWSREAIADWVEEQEIKRGAIV